MSTELTTTKQKADALKAFLDKSQPEFAKVLTKTIRSETFVRILFGACLKVPKLLDCSTASLVNAGMYLAQLGLVPDGRMASLIPFGKEAQVVPGYQGLEQLAYRSGQVKAIHSAVIFEGDDFSWRGTGLLPHHAPAWLIGKEQGRALGAWAGFETTMSGTHVEIMSAEQIGKIKARSAGAKRAESPWNHPDDWAWMWRKSVTKQAMKHAPQSYELAAALALDDAAESGQPQVLPPLDIPHEDVKEPEARAPGQEG